MQYITPLVSNLFFWLWLLISVVLFWLAGKNGFRRTIAVLLIIVLWLVASRPVANRIMAPLEKWYAAVDIDTIRERKLDKIVVLTGGGYPIRTQLMTSAFPMASAYRFWSAIELASESGPDCTLIFSGSAGRTHRERPTAKIMADLAKRLLPGNEILYEAKSGSTAEHPKNVAEFVGHAPFILITSAAHMRRAVRSFENYDLKPVPFPVNFQIVEEIGGFEYLPSAEALWITNGAMREYMALVLYWVRGW